ncbi:hypothetical protein PVMG_05928 [Plasmodium vivax Mauritania I]|uniref:Variable surface protein n=1 Tax=Plasmodium vivax Mauritania I TaxID=1035515 RepID=A0A0J9VQL0_PLAVI|nr:hypothetical protein PVMG_05928 [Plasmodium vivax Mauritania I]
MQKLLCSLMILTILQHLNYDLKLPKVLRVFKDQQKYSRHIYTIVNLFPNGECRFDISKITYKYYHLMLCNSIGPRYGNDERAFISDCPQVAKYIQDIYTTCPVEDKTDRCKYLNYYINYIVKNNSNKNYSVEELIKAYGRLANKLNMCNDSIKVIEESVFKNIEELSNIYYEFNKYINTINTYQTNDCPDLPQSVQLYLNKENTCEGDKNIFCAAVDKFKNYYLSKIKQAKCKNVKYNLESFLSLDNTEIVNNEEEGRQARAKVVEHVTGDRGTEVTATSIHSELDVGDNHDEPSNHNASNPDHG